MRNLNDLPQSLDDEISVLEPDGKFNRSVSDCINTTQVGAESYSNFSRGKPHDTKGFSEPRVFSHSNGGYDLST